jgi:nucleoid DNA-binding protein
MVQKELIERLTESTGLPPRSIRAVLDNFGLQICALKPGEEIRTEILGTFSVSHQDARMGRNPKTGASVEIDPKNVVKFKAAKHIRDGVNA